MKSLSLTTIRRNGAAEFADVTENVLRIARPVLEALKDPKIQPYFRSLSVRLLLFAFLYPIYISSMHPQITDQPRVRPSVVPANREKRVILSLAVPPLSDAAVSAKLVSAVFGLIDALEKINLRPETKTKIKKTRENFAKTLKDESEREAREEAADAKLATKRRAEEERIARLSAAEQQKVILLVYALLLLMPSVSQLLERDRKRNMRKTQGKVVKK
jgi:hypothetical protein